MSLFVKICGITDRAAAAACAEVGVDAVGFVFATSPRQVTPAEAVAIAEDLPTSIARVAVFRRPTTDAIKEVLAGFDADYIQADHDSIPMGLGPKVLPVYRETIDSTSGDTRFLYEGPVSGVGEQVDLTLAAELARRGELILAGGLRPDNVGAAIARVKPFGVDVSSGVETRPGHKDPELIRSFVAAARAAQDRLVTT